jgi:hypothetical protein
MFQPSERPLSTGARSRYPRPARILLLVLFFVLAALAVMAFRWSNWPFFALMVCFSAAILLLVTRPARFTLPPTQQPPVFPSARDRVVHRVPQRPGSDPVGTRKGA